MGEKDGERSGERRERGERARNRERSRMKIAARCADPLAWISRNFGSRRGDPFARDMRRLTRKKVREKGIGGTKYARGRKREKEKGEARKGRGGEKEEESGREGGVEAGEGGCEGRGEEEEERGGDARGGGGSRGVIGKHNLRTSVLSESHGKRTLMYVTVALFFPKQIQEALLPCRPVQAEALFFLSFYLSVSLSLFARDLAVLTVLMNVSALLPRDSQLKRKLTTHS